MWSQRLAYSVIRQFAEDRRRVISEWRLLTSGRRIAHAERAPLPDAKKADNMLQALRRRGDVTRLKGTHGVYIVDVPYANLLDYSAEQVVQEANPSAVFGYMTAMVHHRLTDLLPKELNVIVFEEGNRPRRVPLGTTREDWIDLSLPAGKRPGKVGDTKVVWSLIKNEWDFGVTVGYSAGLPVYVTDVERTLLDALRKPGKCGGIGEVLQAWRRVKNCDVDRLVAYTDRFGLQNLKQRVGFLLETFNRPHPRLANWRGRAQFGGPVRLVARDPCSEPYSADWVLSLNVPPSVLTILEQGLEAD